MRIKYIILMFATPPGFLSCGEKKKKSYDEIAMSGLHYPHRESENQHQGVRQQGRRIGQNVRTLDPELAGTAGQCDSDRCDLKALWPVTDRLQMDMSCRH